MKETLQVAICDDNKEMLEVIAGAIKASFSANGQVIEAETFLSAKQLHTRMKEKQFNVIFLDIDMPQVDGIQFGDYLRKKNNDVDIIFVSGREDRVFESFKVKPYAFVRKGMFLSDISTVVESYLKDSARVDTLLVLDTSVGKVTVKMTDIIYVESYGRKQLVHVFVKNDKPREYEIHSTMEMFGQKLMPHDFLNVSRSYLVNCAFISMISKNVITVKTGEEIIISRERVRETNEKYLDYISRRKNNIII